MSEGRLPGARDAARRPIVEPTVRILGPDPSLRPASPGDAGGPARLPVEGPNGARRPPDARADARAGPRARSATMVAYPDRRPATVVTTTPQLPENAATVAAVRVAVPAHLAPPPAPPPPPPPPAALRPPATNGRAAAAAAAPAVAPAPAPAPAPRQRPKPPPLAVVSKATRPHGRLGALWVAVTVIAMVIGEVGVGIWFAMCAGVAGLQTAKVWRARGEKPLVPLAAATAAILPLCAIGGLRAMTGGIALAVVVTLMARLFAITKAPARDVGLTLAIGVVIGLAVASVVLLRNVNIHAPLLLLAFAAAYDASAYVVGTGASSTWEGPVAGVAMLIPVTMLSAVVLVPPFPDTSPLLLGLIAAILAPCGPLAGSALLGDPEGNAPALRRLDSLLVLAPVWAWVAAAFLR